MTQPNLPFALPSPPIISLTLPSLFLACFTRDKRTQTDRVLHWVGCVFMVLGMAMTVFFLYGTFATP